MIFVIKTQKNKQDTIDFLDRHIWSDTELELPDWGKHKEYTKGLHFTRKDDMIKGIFRKNTWNEKRASSNKWGEFSIHLRFIAKLYENKNGTADMLVFTYPQFIFWLILIIFGILTFAFWYKQDLRETAMFVIPFGMGFAINILDQILLEFRFFKEFKSLLKKNHPFDK